MSVATAILQVHIQEPVIWVTKKEENECLLYVRSEYGGVVWRPGSTIVYRVGNMSILEAMQVFDDRALSLLMDRNSLDLRSFESRLLGDEEGEKPQRWGVPVLPELEMGSLRDADRSRRSCF
jgi:hypothetical protein